MVPMMWACSKKQTLGLVSVVLKECRLVVLVICTLALFLSLYLYFFIIKKPYDYRLLWQVMLQSPNFVFSNAYYSFMGIGVTGGYHLWYLSFLLYFNFNLSLSCLTEIFVNFSADLLLFLQEHHIWTHHLLV